ncbi:MAG: hypothetical protein NT118_03120 [Lentisphaerae bacterium]|nr:hypothetical protein [Lentisphaerota bacterium]
MVFPEEHELKHPNWDDDGYGCQAVPNGSIVSAIYKNHVFGKIKSVRYDEPKKYYVGQIESCADNNELKIKKGDFVSFKLKNVKAFPETTHVSQQMN